MARWMMVAWCVLACAGAGCQEEVIAVRGSTLDQQFSQFNKQGWSVTGGDAGAHTSTANAAPTGRVIKSADFSHLQFNTNLQVEDPMTRGTSQQAQTRPAQSQPAPAGPMMPFGGALPGQ